MQRVHSLPPLKRGSGWEGRAPGVRTDVVHAPHGVQPVLNVIMLQFVDEHGYRVQVLAHVCAGEAGCEASVQRRQPSQRSWA
jgi:hypothetical protein